MGTLSEWILRGDLFGPIPVGDPLSGEYVRTLKVEPIEDPVPAPAREQEPVR